MNMTTCYFRANVGALLHDGQGLALLFRRRVNLRRGTTAPEWQFPQGGIESGETPDQTVRREIAEEAGIAGSLLTLEREAAEWVPIFHEAPNPRDELGQMQKWFLVRIPVGHVAVPDQHEFVEARWVPLTEVLAFVPWYRQASYRAVFQLLSLPTGP